MWNWCAQADLNFKKKKKKEEEEGEVPAGTESLNLPPKSAQGRNRPSVIVGVILGGGDGDATVDSVTFLRLWLRRGTFALTYYLT